MSLSAASPNIFNDEVTFRTSGSGTGILYAAAWPGTEINGNLTIDSPSGLVQFFPGVSIIMKGTADQSINTVGGTPDLIIYSLEIDNPAGDFILNSPITVATSLVLTQGNIISTSTNLLTLNDNVTVTLAWNDKSGGIDNLADLRVARWDGSTTWEDHGNGGTTGDASAGTVVTSSAVTSFSPFTLASSTANNPLPIELLFFSAAVIEYDKVQLKWQTASETDNDFFTIERSINGVDWKTMAIIEGAGNSSEILSYSTLDKNPLAGISYYRLKQTDYDEMFSYSEMRVVKIDWFENHRVNIYPNPTKGLLTVEGDKNELKTVRIYSILGKDVTEQITILEKNETEIALSLTNLKNGIYYCKTKTISQRIVIE